MLTLDRAPAVRRAEPAGAKRCAPRCALLCTSGGLAEAYRRHAGELTGYCNRFLLDHGLAEEIAQEVFVRAWRACAGFTDHEAGPDGAPGSPTRLRAWLFTIARHAVIDAVRGRDRRPSLHPDPDRADHQPDPRDGFARYDTSEQVHRALTQISPRHRAVLVAVFFEGLDHVQVARRLGVPIGTVKSRVHYGLRAVRDRLDDAPPIQVAKRCA